jgi:ABC-type siderophore export system fused ATPase/permease subunit
MRINGIMQELAMRDAIQTARANAIQSNLKGLTDNLSGIAQQAENKRMFDVYMAGQGHELTMLQRLANGEDINDLISEWTAGQDENYRKEFIDRLKKNPRYKNYVGQIK